MFKDAPRTRQNLNIETLRGLACILLVSYHVIISTPYISSQIAADSLLRHSQDILAYIRMPLFTFLSGYVYAMRPFSSGIQNFLLTKARKLLIPMLIASTSLFILRSSTGGQADSLTLEGLLTFYLIPFSSFWFVEALFWIFVVIVILEFFKLMQTPIQYLVVLLITCILYVIKPTLPPYFAIDKTLYLMPYFLIGLGVYRYQTWLFKKQHILFMLIIFFAALTFASIGVITPALEKVSLHSWIALIIGGIGAILLVASNIKISLLAYIGTFSYAIYLFHLFATTSSRVILQKLIGNDMILHFIVGISLGIIAPIFVHIIASRYRLSATLLLGRRFSTKKAPKLKQA